MYSGCYDIAPQYLNGDLFKQLQAFDPLSKEHSVDIHKVNDRLKGNRTFNMYYSKVTGHLIFDSSRNLRLLYNTVSPLIFPRPNSS